MASVAEFLIERLASAGIKHVFGVTGDYVLDFYSKLWSDDNITVINTTDEAHAGFAADAYARVHGIGAVCVTYNVGALKVANAVAGAYAERSPMVVISGSPGMDERQEDVLVHHMVRSFNCQKEIFEKITCASVVLDNPNTAGYEIDKVFEALRHNKQPVYIELPRDVAKKSIQYDVYNYGTPDKPISDDQNLKEAIDEVINWIGESKNPTILAGVELARYDLGRELLRFAERVNIPIVTTLLSKSVIDELHPLFSGIYQGAASHESTRKLVEESDCLLMFGVMLTDLSLSFKPARFKKRQVVSCSVKGLQIRSHIYNNVQFSDFCQNLFRSGIERKRFTPTFVSPVQADFVPKTNTPITNVRLGEKLNSMLTEHMAIVADVGDSLFLAGDLTVHNRNQFLSPAFYLSMGFAIPGALGMQMAMPHIRPIVVVGDGAFQMSVSEISTIINHGLNPIIFVINNDGYSSERFLKDGPFNNIRRWEYHNAPQMFGGGIGVQVKTEEELQNAVKSALDSKEMYLINVMLDRFDVSLGMRRMTSAIKC